MIFQTMKKLGAPCVLLSSAAIQTVQNGDSKPASVLVRRTDLPIYAEENKTEIKEAVGENAAMMEAVRSFRIEACKVAQTVKSATDRCSQFVDTGVAHSYSSYVNATEFLRDDKNLLGRLGAIAGGVVVGYVFSRRRGFFKRLLYPCIGGASVAAVCYPEKANEHYESSLQLSRRYAVIGYHFLNGVTKDFIGVELPSFPQKLQEAVDKNESKPHQ